MDLKGCWWLSLWKFCCILARARLCWKNLRCILAVQLCESICTSVPHSLKSVAFMYFAQDCKMKINYLKLLRDFSLFPCRIASTYSCTVHCALFVLASVSGFWSLFHHWGPVSSEGCLFNRRWQWSYLFHKHARRMHATRKCKKLAGGFAKSNTVSVLVSIKFNLYGNNTLAWINLSPKSFF